MPTPVRDPAVQDGRSRRDHHPEPARAPQHHRSADARRDRKRRSDWPNATPPSKVIVLRGAGRAFSGGYDFGGGFHHWDERLNTDGRWDPGKDFVVMTARTTSPHQKFLAIWRGVQTRHRAGARLVRRWRQRLRPCGRHRHRQRRRRDRHAIRSHVGHLPVGYVVVPPEFREGEVAFADRRTIDRKGSRRNRTHQRVGPVRQARGARQGGRGQAREHPAVPIAGAEAHRQPGLREHGPGLHPDARRHPRRADAQHSRRAANSSTPQPSRACAPRSSAATGRGATTARPRRSADRIRHTSSSRDSFAAETIGRQKTGVHRRTPGYGPHRARRP